jgi:hypothetical protein
MSLPYAAPAIAPSDDTLKLLSVFHLILGGLTGLCSLFPLVHVALGLAMVTGSFPASNNGPPPPAAAGWLFIAMGGGIILLGWAVAGCLILAGVRLRQRRWWTFCLVVAAVSCASFPFGTLLGIFTLLTLAKPEVKGSFT